MWSHHQIAWLAKQCTASKAANNLGREDSVAECSCPEGLRPDPKDMQVSNWT